MKLTDEVTVLKGVGDAVAQKFNVLGINTLAELIDYFPRAYEDYSAIVPINKLMPGRVTVKATIKQSKGRYVRGGLHITEAVASDNTGSVRIVWFNQPYRAAAIKSSKSYYISGNFELSASRLSIMNPSMELVSDLPVNSARILAVYRETKGLSSRQIRQAFAGVLGVIEETKENLPNWLIKDYDLISHAEAIKNIHRPDSSNSLTDAKRRLGFEEVFCLSLASLLNKQENKQEVSVEIKFKKALAKDFVGSLKFNLTDSQRAIIWKIYQDLERTEPMNRIVEGDVGSGKTVVATMAALMVLAADKQSVFMAPTELLARQHGDTIFNLLKPLNLQDQVCLLVGSMSKKEKDEANKHIKNGQAKLIIGTQALIQSNVDMHDLALVIIDEQHRFGVEQRKTLMKKAGHMPHVLSLSATPIPRSLALTLYGELDISLLKQVPKHKLPVITKIVPDATKKRLYESIEKELDQKRQVFIVCPTISPTSLIEAKSVEETFEEIIKSTLGKYKLGLLHGKLKADQKNKIMSEFVAGKIDILVTTTVIEVGVDVPNATVMVVVNPERFGLAQLHQLRGRVGRGKDQGYFYLLVDNKNLNLKRLRALESSSDGFKLAELDLSIRGPGAIYGTMQHGAIDLRVANLSDTELIAQAVNGAKEFIKRQDNLLKYKELAENVNKLRAVTNLN